MKRTFMIIFSIVTSIRSTYCASHHELILKIVTHYQNQFTPLHNSARQAIQEFNQKHPTLKLIETRSDKLAKLIFILYIVMYLSRSILR